MLFMAIELLKSLLVGNSSGFSVSSFISIVGHSPMNTAFFGSLIFSRVGKCPILPFLAALATV